MPKRTASKPSTSANPPSRPKAPRKGKIAGGQKLLDIFPEGEILTDIKGGQWRLGKAIGFGGFGAIYLASKANESPSLDETYVIKIEPHSNGPLFAEMNFYIRVAKTEDISEWMKRKKLKFLGMPRLIGSGSHNFEDVKYRFMVIERFGEDLQKKIINGNLSVLPVKTVFTIALKVLDVLEFIHSRGYIHGDVKATNLVTGYGKNRQNEIYLIDFGLACKYALEGVHKEYKADKRKAHDGTIEYTSRDAHMGVQSRRSDLEILAYNILQWLCGRLPWQDKLNDINYVSTQKTTYMNDIPKFMKTCFERTPPNGVVEFLQYINNLQFAEEPDYEECRKIFRSAIKASGFRDDGELIFECGSSSPKSSPLKKRALSKDGKSNAKTKRQKYAKTLGKATSEMSSSSFVPSHDKVKVISSSKAKLSSSSKASSSQDVTDTYGLDNPTPAMLEVARRKTELEVAGRKTEPTKNQFDNPTPAMLEVARRKVELTKKDNPTPAISKVARQKAELTKNQSDNLTPAMIEVARRKAELVKSQSLAKNGVGSKIRANKKGPKVKITQANDNHNACNGNDNDATENVRQMRKRVATSKSVNF